MISGYSPYILFSYIRWWLDLFYRIFKFLIFKQSFLQYGSGRYKFSPLSLSSRLHLSLLTLCFSRKKKCSNISVIAIDPQFNISYRSTQEVRKYFKIKYLPVALTTHVHDSTSILHFNIARNSLSSSFFATSGEPATQSLCPSFKTSDLLSQLVDLQCFSLNDDIILRINSEGSELSIIYDIIQSNLNLRLVIGSINDVRKKFGIVEYDQLRTLLCKNDIPCVYFKGSDPSTWIKGLSFLDAVLARDYQL